MPYLEEYLEEKQEDIREKSSELINAPYSKERKAQLADHIAGILAIQHVLDSGEYESFPGANSEQEDHADESVKRLKDALLKGIFAHMSEPEIMGLLRDENGAVRSTEGIKDAFLQKTQRQDIVTNDDFLPDNYWRNDAEKLARLNMEADYANGSVTLEVATKHLATILAVNSMGSMPRASQEQVKRALDNRREQILNDPRFQMTIKDAVGPKGNVKWIRDLYGKYNKKNKTLTTLPYREIHANYRNAMAQALRLDHLRKMKSAIEADSFDLQNARSELATALALNDVLTGAVTTGLPIIGERWTDVEARRDEYLNSPAFQSITDKNREEFAAIFGTYDPVKKEFHSKITKVIGTYGSELAKYQKEQERIRQEAEEKARREAEEQHIKEEQAYSEEPRAQEDTAASSPAPLSKKIDDLHDKLWDSYAAFYDARKRGGSALSDSRDAMTADFHMLIAALSLSKEPAYANPEQLPEGVDIEAEIDKRRAALEDSETYRQAVYGSMEDIVAVPSEDWKDEDAPELLSPDEIMKNFDARMREKQAEMDQAAREYGIGTSEKGPNMALFKRRLDLESRNLDNYIARLANGEQLTEADMQHLGDVFTSWMGYVEAANDPRYAGLRRPPQGTRLDLLRDATEARAFMKDPAFHELFRLDRKQDVLEMICGPRETWKDGKPARLTHDEMKKNLDERVKAIEDERTRAEKLADTKPEPQPEQKQQVEPPQPPVPTDEEVAGYGMDYVAVELYEELARLDGPVRTKLGDQAADALFSKAQRISSYQTTNMHTGERSEDPGANFKTVVEDAKKYLRDNPDIVQCAQENGLLGARYDKLMNRANTLIDKEMYQQSAAKWIEDFKRGFRDHPDQVRKQGGYPAAHIAHIMAARELSNSVRGKASTLNEQLRESQIKRRAAQIIASGGFKAFAKTLEDPEKRREVEGVFTKRFSHGGELDDEFRKFLRERPAGQLENDPELKRWMPTVKQRVEHLQKQAARVQKEKKVPYAEAAEILLLRKVAGVQRGGKGLDKPIPLKGERNGKMVPSLSELVSSNANNAEFQAKFNKENVKKHILSGHGGAMAENYNKEPAPKQVQQNLSK